MGSAVVECHPVRVRQAPVCDPPYDDERHPDSWAPLAQPQLDLTGRSATMRPATNGDQGLSAHEASGASPATRTAATRFLHTCLEILNGHRPMAHFRHLSSPLDAATVVQAMTHAVRRLDRVRRRAGTPSDRRIRPGRFRLCQPCPGVAEIAAVVHAGPRAWALAVRLEQRGGRWLCTAAQLLEPMGGQP